MKSFIFAAAALAAGAFAVPSSYPGEHCLTKKAATHVADNFKDLINLPFNKILALSALAKDFHDYSDSVIELINNGCPNEPVALGSATFASRKEFIKGQSSQDPIPFEILNLWYNCDAITIRWKTSAPGTVKPEEQVTGIIVLEVVQTKPGAEEPWQIETVYSEFNSGAWLYDLGIFKPSCGSSKVKRSDGLPTIM